MSADAPDLRDLVDIASALIGLQTAVASLAVMQGAEKERAVQSLLSDVDARIKSLIDRLEQKTRASRG